jgi:SecD/SecF fusion protein
MEKYAKLKFSFIAILVALWFYFFWASGIPLGPDLAGGFELLYRLQLKEGSAPSSEQINETIEVIQNRIDAVGLKEIRVQSYGSEHIIVNLPGGSELEKEQIKAVVERMGVLYFELIAKQEASSPDPYRFSEDEIKKVKEEQIKIEKENRDRAERGEELVIPPRRVVPFVQRDKEGKETERFETIVETADRVSGGLLSRINPTQNNLGQPAVGFEFNSEGANQFKHLTREENVGRYLAIVLDDVVQSAPVLRTTISGRGIIEGRFTRDEVNQQVIILKSGSLPTKPALDREFSVGPMLGERAIRRGITAIIIGIILVLLIMGIYYLAAGMVSNLVLIINVILIVGSLSASAATFTLPGFAGLILTIGMAVDANILIFERIREEKAKGKSLRQATETGFARAFWTIFDANVTTLLTALILLWAGTGPIRGFAVTLSIGILCSMFAALFIMRALLGFLIDKRILKELKMLQILKKPNVPFVKARHVAFTLSMIMIIAGLFLFFSRGDEKYGIDFTGGSLFQISLREPETISEVKQTVHRVKGLEDAIVVATYLNFPGEQPDKGIAISFTIRTRTVEIAEVDEETGRTRQFQEVLHQRIKEAFKNRLAPLAIDTSREVIEEQKKFEAEQKKAVAYVYARKGEDDDPKVLAEAAARALNDNKDFRGTTVKVAEKEGDTLANFVRLRVETEETDFALTPLKQVVGNIGSIIEKAKDVRLSEPFPRVDTIGASVAYNLKSKAVVALTLAMIGIIIYIAVRFELKFGFAAVFALGHDVAIALGAVTLVDMLGLVDMKIDLPTTAAFLTIIGYSLNDTIVVFDRIRENIRRREFDAKKSKENYAEIINDSINETISRTLLTSFTTFIVVLVLFLSGVEAIAGFTFAMLVGVVVGTYSSIFIASPILIFMRPAELKKK